MSTILFYIGDISDIICNVALRYIICNSTPSSHHFTIQVHICQATSNSQAEHTKWPSSKSRNPKPTPTRNIPLPHSHALHTSRLRKVMGSSISPSTVQCPPSKRHCMQARLYPIPNSYHHITRHQTEPIPIRPRTNHPMVIIQKIVG